MKQFNVDAFLKICLVNAGLPKTQAAELNKYPENEFLLKTTKQINEDFQLALDEAKHEVGLLPDEVYVTRWADGTSTANLGSTLLACKVTFSDNFDVKKLSKDARDKDEFLLFELLFLERYHQCCRLVNTMEREISGAYNARDVPVDERASVLQALEEEHKARCKLLRILSKQKYVTQEKEEIQKHLNHLEVLISKLKRIHKGHY